MAIKIINSKAEVKALITPIINGYSLTRQEVFIKQINTALLKKKIRFPILEYATREIIKVIPEKEQICFVDSIISLDEIGGNVIAGIVLQERLAKYAMASINKAVEYIIRGDQWYVCDIIGERVMGYALLTDPGKTIPVLRKFAKHPDKWVVRCIGVATHYATKKGLKKNDAEQMFQLLLTLSYTTEFHTKKGIGWAAKTISKFHPGIIAKYKTTIEQDDKIKQWFKTKIKIGLGRSFKYAAKYSDKDLKR
ncbi:MAG: DNA alkylation repair protein [Ferruginibacter sp.]